MNNKSGALRMQRRDKEFIVEIKKLAASTAMAGALGLAAFGLGNGLAQADPKFPGPPNPPGPGYGDIWLPGDPPGHNPFGPPGQVKKQPTINGVPNPFYGVPPGHWDDPVRLGLPPTWIPPNFPDVKIPLPVVWNPGANAFGVWVGNVFVPYPLPR